MRCRARYVVTHQEWRCRKCSTVHLGDEASLKKCKHCGAKRHFSNTAPAVLPAVAAAFSIFGVILVMGGALTRHGPKNQNDKPLINVGEVILADPMAAPVVPPGPDGFMMIDIPASMTIEHARPSGDLVRWSSVVLRTSRGWHIRICHRCNF